MAGKRREIRVQSLKNQALIADKCLVAESFFDRLRGLIGRAGMNPGEGVLFPKCSSIHMWFMRFPIDVVFVSTRRGADGSVTPVVSSVHERVRPWRPHPLIDWRAQEVLELPVGSIRLHAIEVGDELCLS